MARMRIKAGEVATDHYYFCLLRACVLPCLFGFFLFCFCFLVTSLSLLATAMAFGSIWDKQSPAWERYKDNGGKGEVGIMGDRASFP